MYLYNLAIILFVFDNNIYNKLDMIVLSIVFMVLIDVNLVYLIKHYHFLIILIHV